MIENYYIVFALSVCTFIITFLFQLLHYGMKFVFSVLQ